MLRGTTRQVELLQVVLRVTMRYYELYCKSLCGITRDLCGMWYYERYNLCFFRGILPKIIFQKNRYEKFYKIGL